jgi:hypothetical protein
MAKEGQHKNDAHDQTKSKGHNNPSKSVTITTGSYKKQETYRKQAGEHNDTARQAQSDKNEWNEDTRDKPTIAGSTRARHPRSGRSGSDSNASSGTRGH